jgi:uncharacterized cupin superfamily protein
VTVLNLFGGEWERENDRPGFRWRSAAVGRKVGGAQIGATVYELPPGERTWPYHFHVANEEWLVCLAGRPTLRTPDGDRELAPGDVAVFPRGPAGAHQLANRADEPARLLLLSTRNAPDVVEYLDSGKVGMSSGSGYRRLLRATENVDYWEGEG